MTKTQAAAHLGVSVRTLQRLMTAGKIAFKMTKTPTGPESAVFDRAELDRYQQERVKELVSPSVSTSDNLPAIVAPAAGGAQSVSLGRFSELRELAEVLRPAPAPPVALVDKLALSVAEASLLTGYSQAYIRGAIRAGKLKGVRGRRPGYDIKRSDLEAWVKKL